VNLITPYTLPFRVMYQPVLESIERDITLRILLADTVSTDAASAIDSTVLPFFLMGTSGALAGESIQPWTSTIKEWSQPLILGSAIEWLLTSVTVDPQAWVMLAQMLLVDHKKHAIKRVEIFDPRSSHKMVEVITGKSGFNPYPNSWTGISFAVDFYEDISKNFTVCAVFSRSLSKNEQALISEELFAWAPGLILGAYGVAPVPPDRCTGIPDEDIVFVDNELEWSVSNFKAHTGAIEGLINVFASLSKKIVPVTEFRIE